MKNLSKLMLITLLGSMVLGFIPGYVYAESTDEEVNISETSHGSIDISAEVKTQNPLTKSIPIEITYTPKVDGIRGYLTVSDYSGLVPTDDKVWVPIEKDTTYKKTIHLTPKYAGDYDVVVDLIIFGYDVNYGDSTTVRITLGENLVVKETATLFFLYQVLMYLIIAIGIVALVIMVKKYGVRVATAFKNWIFNDPKYKDLQNSQEIESFYKQLHEKGESEAPPKS